MSELFLELLDADKKIGVVSRWDQGWPPMCNFDRVQWEHLPTTATTIRSRQHQFAARPCTCALRCRSSRTRGSASAFGRSLSVRVSARIYTLSTLDQVDLTSPKTSYLECHVPLVVAMAIVLRERLRAIEIKLLRVQWNTHGSPGDVWSRGGCVILPGARFVTVAPRR